MGIISGQATTFLITVALGFVLGIFYDVFRIFRQSLALRAVLGALFDMLFWLSVTLILFFVLLHVNFGELRFFSFLGIALGMILHFLSFSPILIKLAEHVKKGLRKCRKYVIMKGDKFAKEVARYGKKTRAAKRGKEG